MSGGVRFAPTLEPVIKCWVEELVFFSLLLLNRKGAVTVQIVLYQTWVKVTRLRLS